MPATIDRETTAERTIPKTKPPAPAPPPSGPTRQRRVIRWIQWMAGATILVLTVGAGMWFASREAGPTIQEQAAEWPDCWPLCSAAAEVEATAALVTSPGVAAPAVLPDCWPLCSHAANAVTVTPQLAAAASYPDCWPLCAETARIVAAQPPACWPLCAHAAAAVTP